MIELDHIAITTNDLNMTIEFYKNLGYNLEKQFFNKEEKWATLSLKSTSIEIFESPKKEASISHIAYNYDNKSQLFSMLKPLTGKDDYDTFLGDLNREAFFIEDNNGISLQFIKKE